jgi:ABC-type hemin transport system substrate-binding protein
VGTEIVLALGQRERLLAVDAASAGMRGVGDLPVTESAAAGSFAPDVVLAPPREAAAVRRSAPAARIIEVEPHNFDDAWELCTSIGAALGREREAHRFVLETSRPLAELGRESFGARRPRVAALLALEPLAVAGGHSFATDLIELAGGESVSHGTEEIRLAWTSEDLARAAPELVVVVTSRAPSPRDLELGRRLLGGGPRVEFLVFDAERLWLRDSLPAARQLRSWIADLSVQAPAGAPARAR